MSKPKTPREMVRDGFNEYDQLLRQQHIKKDEDYIINSTFTALDEYYASRVPSVVYQIRNKTNPDGFFVSTKEKAEKFLEENDLNTGTSGWEIIPRKVI